MLLEYHSNDEPAAGEVQVHAPSNEPEVRPGVVLDEQENCSGQQGPERQEVPERFASNIGPERGLYVLFGFRET